MIGVSSKARSQDGWWERWGRSYLLPILLVVVVGAVLRLWAIDALPPGLASDEAAEGLDARAILNGARPVFLPSNNGREPFFAYCVAAVMAIFGPGVTSIRLAAALLGILTLPAAYLCFRGLLGPRVAFLGALALAISTWHLHLSRLGFRVVAEPLFAALAVFFLVRALRQRRLRDWALSGFIVGGSIYTYIPARLFALLLVLLPLLWFLTYWPRERAHWRRQLAGFALLVIAAAVVSLPLGSYFLRQPSDFLGRADQVSVLNAIRGGADAATVLLRNTVDTLLMLVWRGDANPRHNLPGQPIFDVLLAGPFLLGLAVSLWRLRRGWGREIAARGLVPRLLPWLARGQDGARGGTPASLAPRYRTFPGLAGLGGTALPSPGRGEAGGEVCLLLFSWLWLLVMLVPAVLSDSAPHALRAVGLLPVTHLFVGLGLATLWGWVAGWKPGDVLAVAARRRTEASLMIGLLLAASAALTAFGYFWTWAKAGDTWEAFDGDRVVAARLVSQLPSSTLALVGPAEPDHPSFRFLLHSQAEVRLFGWDTFPLVERADRDVVYVVLGDVERAQARLAAYYPQGRRTDDSLNPPLSASSFSWTVPAGSPRGSPPAPSHPLQRRLGGTVELLGYDLDSPATVGSSLTLRLYWRVLRRPPADYVAFVHLVGPDGEAWAQQDREPGAGASPTSSWGEGDVVIDERRVPIPPGTVPDTYKVVVGLYERDGAQRLEVRDEEGKAIGNQIALGSLPVAKAARRLSASLLSPPNRSQAVFVNPAVAAERLRLFGYGLNVGQVKAGEGLGLVLYWQSLANLSGDYQVRLQLVAADGAVLAEQSERPVRGRYATSGWSEGEIVRDPHRLLVPPTTPAGQYGLRFGLVAPNGERLALEGSAGGEVELGSVEVLPRPPEAAEPVHPSHPFQAGLAGIIRFLGYDLDASPRKPGDPVGLRLYWQASGPIDTSYTVFTHLLDAKEKVWGQKDSPPRNGTLPTTAWLSGQVVVDPYELIIDPQAPPGQYTVEIGMYDPATGARLPIVDGSGRPLGDRLLLGQVEVAK